MTAISGKAVKKTLSLVLVLAAILSSFAAILPTAVGALEENEMRFSLPGGGMAILEKYLGHAKSVSVPETVGGCRVTTIGLQAFEGNKTVVSVTLPDSVYTIDDQAFMNCSSLETVKLGKKTSYIGNDAFAYCSKLKNVAFPATVELIGTSAFIYCDSLTSVAVPDAVTQIKGDSFRYCASLKTVSIGKNADSVINSGAFLDCPSLERIDVAEGNPYFCSFDGAVYNADGSELLLCPCAKPAISFKKGVERIGARAFSHNTKMTYVEIPGTVTQLGAAAFEHCTALKEVDLPGSLTVLGSFEYCTALRSVNVPEGIKTISGYAFSGCVSLKEIILPRSLVLILPAAFSDTALSSVKYRSSASDWKKIDVYPDGNEKLISSKKTYNFDPKTPGDVNRDGKLNARDVTALMKAIVRGAASSAANADFNADGKVNAKDVTALMKKLVAK